MTRIIRAFFALTLAFALLLSEMIYPLRALANPASSSEPIQMNLSSRARRFSAESLVQDASVTIRSRGRNLTVTKDSLLTAAEALAVHQVITTGVQSLRLGQRGVAVGGNFAIASDANSAIGDLVIPKNVTAINALKDLNLSGDLVNKGTLFTVSSNSQVNEAAISAANIYNRNGASISTVVGSDVMHLLAAPSALNQNLGLALNAANEMVNNGTISSAGNLTLSAGTRIVNASVVAGSTAVLQAANTVNLAASNVVNSGVISALSGNLNVASQVAQRLGVDNTGGVMQALNGVMNFSTGSNEQQRVNIDFLGGSLAAKELNFTSTGGDVTIDAKEVTGKVNICAANAFMFASTPNLVLGDMALSDDPQFYNQGNITISGNLTYSSFVANDNLVIVASQDIVSSGGNWNIGSAGEAGVNSISVLMVAGASFTTNGSSSSGSASNGGGDSSGTTVITINGGTIAGGMIDLNTAPISSLSTEIPSGNGSAGSITLVAFGGTGTNAGTVKVPAAVTINTKTSDLSPVGLNGPVMILAGKNSSGNAIEIGGINTSGNLMNPQVNNGSITVAAATPVFVNSSGQPIRSLVLTAGGGNAGNPIIANGNNFAPGTAQPGSIEIGGSIVAGANVSISAGGNVNLNGNVSLTQNPQLQPVPAAYLASPTLSIAAGGTLTVPNTSTVSAEVAGCTVCSNTVNLTANQLNNAGTIVGHVVNVTSNSASSPLVVNNTGTIIGGQQQGGANDNGFINVSSLGDLQLSGTGTYKTTGAVSVIEIAAADNHQLQLGSSNTFNINTNSLLIFNAQGSSGNIVETGNTQTIQAGSATDNNVVSINTPSLNLSNGSTFDGTSGATSFALTAGTTANDLTITVASGATASIKTTAVNGTGLVSTVGGIYMRPRDGQNLTITSTAASTLNLETNLAGLNPLLAAKGGSVSLSPNVTIPQSTTTSPNPSGGIVGTAFQPYVGGTAAQSGSGFVLFGTYSYQQVLALLGPVVATQQFQIVSTYTQQFSAGFVIKAAKQVGLRVSAGVFLEMDDSGNNISQAVTNSDISLALQNASTYGNVFEIVVGNEDITGDTNPTKSINTLIGVIEQTQTLRNSTTSFDGTSLPVTTRQVGGVYLNVLPSTNGKGPASAMKNLLQKVDGYVLADWYPLLEPNVISALQQDPTITQPEFAALVINDIQDNDFLPIANAFVDQNVTTQIRVGETGWATAGPFQAQPQWAAWYYAAMQQWSHSATNPLTGGKGVPIQAYFESYDEPWKPINVGTQEPHFGIWTASGTNNGVGSFYDLQSITQKYSLPLFHAGAGAPPSPPQPKLTDLDLFSPDTTAQLVAGQGSGQYGGTLMLLGNSIIGGNLVLNAYDVRSTLSQIRIPLNVTVTIEHLPAQTEYNIALTDEAVVLQGSLNFTGVDNAQVAMHITATEQSAPFGLHPTGALNFAPPQGNFLLSVGGGQMGLGGSMTGNFTLQTKGKHDSIALSGLIGSPTSLFDIQLSGKSSLIQHSGVIIGSSINLTTEKGTFDVTTRADTLTGTTRGSMTVRNTSPAVNVLAMSAGKSLEVFSNGHLTVSGTLTAGKAIHLSADGDISIDNAVSSKTIAVSSQSNGEIVASPGVVLSASKGIQLTAFQGQIGNLTEPVKTNTRLLSVNGDDVFISNSHKLKFSSISVVGELNVVNTDEMTVKEFILQVGKLVLRGAPGSDVSIKLDADLSLHATTLVNLTATGAGNIRVSTAFPTETLVLSTEGGFIKGVTDADKITATTGPGGSVTLSNLGSTEVSGSAGVRFQVTTEGDMSVGNVSSATGNIFLTSTSGKIDVDPGAMIVASNGNVTLNAENQSAGTIFLGAGSTVSAAGPGSGEGKVSIFVGDSLRKENTNIPANVVDTVTGDGHIFVGANSILCNSPDNTITANGKTVAFSTGTSGAAAITLDGGVSVLAQVKYTEVDSFCGDYVVDTGDCDEGWTEERVSYLTTP